MSDKRFTPAQKSALDTQKNLFVEAGAGSGKTAVLVSRYLACLREHPDCSPDNILAITFTKKAAQEMKERIHDSLIDQEEDHEKEAFRYRTLEQLHKAHISTIHGCCSEILAEYPLESGCDPQSQVLDAVTAYRHQREIVMQTVSTFHHSNPQIMSIIGATYSFAQLREKLLFMFKHSANALKWINSSVTPEIPPSDTPLSELATREAMTLMTAMGHLFKACYDAYQHLKSQQGFLDYDDQISKTLTLLKTHPTIQKRYQTQFRFIMIDEFQDTDPEQWELLDLLSHPSQTTRFIVGDPKQAIYGFRGADSHLFERIKSEFTLAKRHGVIFLDDNFRSQSAVLEWINERFSTLFLLGESTITYHPLIPHRPETGGSVTVQIEEELEEAEAIIEWIQNLRLKNPALPLHDIAILCRTKQGMTGLKNKLEKAGLPVMLHHKGGKKQDASLTAVLTWVRFLENPHDELALIAASLHTPSLGFDGHEWLALSKAASDTANKGNSWWTILQNGSVFDEKNHDKWQSFKDQATQFITAFESSLFNEALLKLVHFLGFGQDPLMQLLIRQAQAAEFEEAWAITQGKTWLDALFELGLSDHDEMVPTQGAIQLMTIHASKGLEFPCVAIPFCGRKFNFSGKDPILFSGPNFPGLSYKTHNGKGTNLIREALLKKKRHDTVEEEKRVFYVACTRARDHLLITAKVPSLEKLKKTASENPESVASFLLAS